MMLTAGFTLIAAKLAIILLVILFTSPIATHALAQAAMHAGMKPVLKNRRVLGLAAGRKPLEAKRASRTRTTGRTARGRRPAGAKGARS